MANIFSFIGEIFSPVAKLVDDLHTSDEEKGEIEIAKQKILYEVKKAEIKAQMKVLEYETKLQDNQSKIIIAEAQGESWLQRNWRPLMMITFAGLVVARWLGWTAPGITEAVEKELFLLIQIGLGGYVVGRSGEKITKMYMGNK